eukprot:scaffold201893_cov25-Tisochrysis_lutea.AAC.1
MEQGTSQCPSFSRKQEKTEDKLSQGFLAAAFEAPNGAVQERVMNERVVLFVARAPRAAQVIHSKGRAVLALPWKPRSCAPHAAVANGGCCRACQDGRLVTCNAS